MALIRGASAPKSSDGEPAERPAPPPDWAAGGLQNAGMHLANAAGDSPGAKAIAEQEADARARQRELELRQGIGNAHLHRFGTWPPAGDIEKIEAASWARKHGHRSVSMTRQEIEALTGELKQAALDETANRPGANPRFALLGRAADALVELVTLMPPEKPAEAGVTA